MRVAIRTYAGNADRLRRARQLGVEISSIIVDDVMRDRFQGRSGRLYFRPDVSVHVDDGRTFIARSRDQYDLIQASLVAPA